MSKPDDRPDVPFTVRTSASILYWSAKYLCVRDVFLEKRVRSFIVRLFLFLWDTCSFVTFQTRRSRASDTKRLIQNQETKNKDTPAPLFPGVATAILSQFDTDPSYPKKQQHSRLPSISTNPKRSTHVSSTKRSGQIMRTSCPCWFMDLQ